MKNNNIDLAGIDETATANYIFDSEPMYSDLWKAADSFLESKFEAIDENKLDLLDEIEKNFQNDLKRLKYKNPIYP